MKAPKTTQLPVNHNVAVAFYRVSTEKQSNDRQYEDVQKYCKAYDFQLPEGNEFQETISGATKISERPDLKRMLAHVEATRPNYVVCSELSRLARADEALTIIKDWTSKGICFITLKEGIRTIEKDGTTNPMTDLLLKILNAINVFELETIRYRVKSGLSKTINNGTWSGGQIPYGYDLVNKFLVKNESEVKNIITMYEKYADGWANHKIAVYLNNANITTKQGAQWKDTTIYKVLSNPIYVGRRQWSGQDLNTPETRIVSDELFAAVQDRLSKRENTALTTKQSKYEYLLKGKIICSCGLRMVGQGRNNLYMCRTNKYGKGCGEKSISMSYLDDEVKKQLIGNNFELLQDSSKNDERKESLKVELSILQEKQKAEKQQQNYLINNMAKIGQLKFDLRYDESINYSKQLEANINAINAELNNINAMNDYMQKLNTKIKGGGIRFPINPAIKNDNIIKVIDRIDIKDKIATVKLIDGNMFVIGEKDKYEERLKKVLNR